MVFTATQTYRRDKTFHRSRDGDTRRFEKRDFLQLDDVTIAKHHHDKLSLLSKIWKTKTPHHSPKLIEPTVR
jgi:hypothetical protein